MSDPVSSYRSACSNASLMVSGDATRECGRAAIRMLEAANAGLEHHSIDAPAARAALEEGDRALSASDLPDDMRDRLASQFSELNSRLDGLEAVIARRQDHVAPARSDVARPGATAAASPRQTISAGLHPALARMDRSMLASEIQHAMFRDRPQTTRTLSALAALSPAALRELVTERVGAFHAPAVLERIGDNAQMQMRVRVSERAQGTLMRGAQRLQDRSAGDGLQSTLNRLRGAHGAPVGATLVALGVDRNELTSLLARQVHPADGASAARHELATLVADTMRGGAEQMRELAQRYDAAHNVLDRRGALYTLFPESVRQTSAQLGVPSDASRSALGSFVQQDVANATSAASLDNWIVLAATLASTLATGGLALGVVGTVGLSAVRSGAGIGIAYQHADEMATSAAAGDADAEAAADALTDAHVALGLAAGATLLGIVGGHGADYLTGAGAREAARVAAARLAGEYAEPIVPAVVVAAEAFTESAAHAGGHRLLLGH